MGDSPELYHALLSDERLRQFHLAPLSGYPEGAWIEKAKLALDKGYSVEAVADSVYGPVFKGGPWVRSLSATWKGWVERFDKLCSHDDRRIREVGETGKAKALVKRESALQEERRREVYGGYV